MIFSERFVTKWHDTDAQRKVRLSQMLVYMQEVSGHHMKSCGPSLDELRDKHGLAFILSKCAMDVCGELLSDEEIEVQTWTCDGKGYSITRFYRILKGEEIIATAETVWALVNIKDKSLVRQEALDVYSFENEPSTPIETPRRFRLPKDTEMKSVGERRIVYSDLDYNMHMNNTRYPNMLCDYLSFDEIGRIKGVFLSYLREAAYGDVLDVRLASAGNERYFKTVGRDGASRLEAIVILKDK